MAEQKIFDLLTERIARTCEGLTYVSETDAAVTLFGPAVIEEFSAERIADAAGVSATHDVETSPAAAFFARLTNRKDWFGDAENEKAKRFGELYKLLSEHLRDLTVFRFGAVRIDIVVAGIDSEGNTVGIRTFAVET
jgi:hypothetical protein